MNPFPHLPSGIPIKTTLDNSSTVQYAGLIHQLVMKARSTIRDIDPQNDLTFLRVRSKKNEIMIAPGEKEKKQQLSVRILEGITSCVCLLHISKSHKSTLLCIMGESFFFFHKQQQPLKRTFTLYSFGRHVCPEQTYSKCI